MAVQKKLYTVAEFEAFIARPENKERLFELVEGKIVQKVVTEEHGFIAGVFITEINLYLRQNKIGRAGVEVSYRVPGDEHNERLPDISVRIDTSKPIVKEGPIAGMPDLAIEIKSPGDSYKELLDKAAYYLANGTRLVWLVYPEKKLIEVLSPDSRQLLDINDTLDGGDVLPGFTIAVKAIFVE